MYGGRYHGLWLRDWPHSHFVSEVAASWDPIENDPYRVTRRSVKQVWQKWLVRAEVHSPLMGMHVSAEDVVYVLDPLTPAAFKEDWLFDCFGVLRYEGGKAITIEDVDRLIFLRGRRDEFDFPDINIPSSHQWVISARVADVTKKPDRYMQNYRPFISMRAIYDEDPHAPKETEEDWTTT